VKKEATFSSSHDDGTIKFSGGIPIRIIIIYIIRALFLGHLKIDGEKLFLFFLFGWSSSRFAIRLKK